MGKSNKPTKWFKAVKKAFRSPSKERPQDQDQDTKVDADDQKLLAKHDLSPVSHQTPTPHPLPSFEIITHDEVEPEHSHGKPLPMPGAVHPAISAQLSDKALEKVVEEENSVEEVDHTINNADVNVGEKNQDDDDDSTLSEEEEAAIRIQQRFSEPLALKGLIRLQALVRGHQVRRQAATTLLTMEAIVRVQSVFRGRRARMSKDGRAVRSRISKRRRLSSRGGLHGTVSRGEVQDKGPQASGGEEEANKRKRPTGNLLTQQLKRSTPNRSSLFIDCGPGQPHWGWAWLDLWTHARPWEIRSLEDSKDSKNSKENSKDSKDSKDYIEIIPSRKNSKDFTTKEVDVNTLKVKYYEDYIPNPAPAKCRLSSPMAEKKEFAKSPSSMAEKKEFSKPPSPMAEKKESAQSPSPMVEKKESAKTPSSVVDKKEFAKSSSPMAEKKESAKSTRLMVEKKEPVARSPSPMADKKEPARSPSPLVEKKEPPARSPSTFSEKKKPVVSSSPSSEKKDLGRSSPSPLPEKKEPASIVPECVVVPEWQHSGVPVPSPVPLPAPPPAHSHRVISKPPPIEVFTHPGVEEDRPAQVLEPSTPEPQKSPIREKSVPPSPAASEDSIPVPPSPQASDASLPVPETPPGLGSAGDDPSVTTEHVVLPEAHTTNGGELNGESITHQHSDSLSASNGEHQPGEDTPSDKGSASDVVNGHVSNGHEENGDKSRKGEKVGEIGDSPIPSKRPTCRYMAATESAKAKFRSSSNPKTRAPDTPESPGRTPKRYSIGGTPASKGADSPKTAFGTRKTNSFQNRGSPSPKAVVPKEIKPRSADTGAESPARRNSLGGGMRWRT